MLGDEPGGLRSLFSRINQAAKKAYLDVVL
jgi:hypothetical protein